MTDVQGAHAETSLESTDLLLQGQTVLVTGGTSGLGRHFAELLARHGATVVVAARRTELLADTVHAIRSGGGSAFSVEMDVTDEASVMAGFSAAEVAAGPIGIVIANAGMSSAGMALDLPSDDFDRIMAVNVRGPFLTAREAARRMTSRPSDRPNRIILVASIGGLKPLPGLAAYSTSKAAVVMLGQSLAREWVNKGINVNILCPGYIRTDLNGEWFDGAAGQRQVEGFPRRRLMQLQDLDGILMYLVGDASAATTGAVFKIDDGQIL